MSMKLFPIDRSTIRMGTIDYYLERMGRYFVKLEVFSTAGDIRPPAPFQWQATSIVFSDDRLEGFGWTPQEALKDLYNQLQKL